MTLNAENDWTQTITDLPVYAGGETIHYTWHENGAEGYLRTNTSVNGSVTTLTNTHVPATTARTVRKVWADQENVAGMRPDSVTAYLLANGERVESVILNEENQWTATLEKLPVSQAGQPIAYTWAEEPVDGYVLTVEDQADATVLTNTYDPEITSVTVTKVWDDSDDQDALRPDAITVNLLADGTQIATAEIKGDGNTWTYTFENLPKHADGKEIEYTVTEAEVAGYTAQIDGFTITNTHPAAQPVPPQPVSVTVTKVWNDGSNQDGLRPGSVTVRLLADGKEVASHAVTGTGDTWTYTFTGLDRMNGEREIVYTVTEDAVPGYSTSVNGYTVTNTHEPELISIRGSKVWKDNNNQQHMRPANVVIQLLADGQAIASQTISGSGNRWYFTFKDLPRYAQGRAIRYTVAEIEVEGYTTQIEGYTVTNTLKQPYTLTVYYQYLDGTTAAPTFFEINEEGDLYDIISPVIPGYKATLLRISGTQPARNIEFVVIYIPTTTPYDPTDPVDPINPPHGPVIIEDYETPLGLGEVNLNAGDCYE